MGINWAYPTHKFTQSYSACENIKSKYFRKKTSHIYRPLHYMFHFQIFNCFGSKEKFSLCISGHKVILVAGGVDVPFLHQNLQQLVQAC